jgi:hypothetical protein
MLQKTVAAGVCGLGLGAMMAFRVPKQQRTLALALKSSLTSALSLSMLSFTFSGALLDHRLKRDSLVYRTLILRIHAVWNMQVPRSIQEL